VSGRVGVETTNGDLQLTHDTGQVLLVLGDEGDRAHTLAVQAHVLRVGLRDEELVAVLGEQARAEAVLVDVTAGEALVGQVNERQQVSSLEETNKKKLNVIVKLSTLLQS
jgi:hypothetical protein